MAYITIHTHTHTHIYIYINKGMPLVYFSTVFFHSSSSWCGRLIYIHKRTDREQSLTPSIIEHSPFHFFPWLSMRPWDMAQQSLIKSEISRADSLQTDLLPALMIHWWHVKETLSTASSSVIPTACWTTETQCTCASNKRKSHALLIWKDQRRLNTDWVVHDESYTDGS